jgi:nucleoside phosphorylase
MNSFSQLLQERFPNLEPANVPIESQRQELSSLYDRLLTGPTTNIYDRFNQLEQFLDYFADFAGIEEAESQKHLLRSLLSTQISLLTGYEYLNDLVMSIVQKYDLQELYLLEALTHYRNVRYDGFYYSKYVKELLDIYSNYKDNLYGYDHLFVDALYSHLVGLGDSEIGYEFGGLETVRKHIHILDIALIKLLLQKYEKSSVQNFPFGWSYLGNAVWEKQIKTIIDSSSLDANSKTEFLYYYLQSFTYKTVIVQTLYASLSHHLKEHYDSVISTVETLRDFFKIDFKHKTDESKDIELIMQSDEANQLTKYTLKRADTTVSDYSITQLFTGSEIRITYKFGQVENYKRFVYRPHEMVSIQGLHKMLEEKLEDFAARFFASIAEDMVEEQPVQQAPFIAKRYDIAVVCAMRSELEGLRSVASDWELLTDQPASTDSTTNYYSCNFRDQSGKEVRVVAACCHQKGMAATATLSTKLITLFQPEYLVMTGIAAGIRKSVLKEGSEGPRSMEEVKLGDILVVTVTWDHGSGKITTDNGSSNFLPAPNPINLQPRIRSKIELLAADSALLEQIRKDWDRNEQLNLKNKTGPAGLAIHCGPMLSGAAVLANKDAIEGIKKQHKDLIGIDMESYSVFYAAENSPGVQPKVFVLKSVSDYADEHKNDELQAYAAYTSAATLKALALNFMDYEQK